MNFECLSHPEKHEDFARHFEFVQEILDKRFNRPLWKISELFTKEGVKMRLACNNLSEYVYDIINKKKNEETLKENNDILSVFINYEIIEENENVRNLSNKELRDIILNLILAGTRFIKNFFDKIIIILLLNLFF